MEEEGEEEEGHLQVLAADAGGVEQHEEVVAEEVEEQRGLHPVALANGVHCEVKVAWHFDQRPAADHEVAVHGW